MGKIVLVTGGARSGKSQYVMDITAKTGQRVLFVATAEAGDAEMQARIAAHKKSRPASWRTLETRSDIGNRIRENIGDAQIVIIDCITLLANNILMDGVSGSGKFSETKVEKKLNKEIESLLACISRLKAEFYIVTNEVGLGIVPEHPMGRLYRDLLGKVNQKLAEPAGEVYFMVAGLPLKVK